MHPASTEPHYLVDSDDAYKNLIGGEEGKLAGYIVVDLDQKNETWVV